MILFYIIISELMLSFARNTGSILRHIRYTFIPPSCYDIDAKPNPVVSVTLGTEEASYCDLHFRVAFI